MCSTLMGAAAVGGNLVPLLAGTLIPRFTSECEQTRPLVRKFRKDREIKGSP